MWINGLVILKTMFSMLRKDKMLSVWQELISFYRNSACFKSKYLSKHKSLTCKPGKLSEKDGSPKSSLLVYEEFKRYTVPEKMLLNQINLLIIEIVYLMYKFWKRISILEQKFGTTRPESWIFVRINKTSTESHCSSDKFLRLIDHLLQRWGDLKKSFEAREENY